MIDVNVLRDTPDIVRASATARGEDPAQVDEVLAADTARRQALLSFETQRAEQKTLGKQVASATGDAKAELLTRTFSQGLAASARHPWPEFLPKR